MRVISGKFKGRKLLAPTGQAVRPTIDRVKESVFDILQARIEGAVVLDLFAGSGALGIEAVSRGAAEVWFVDKSRESAEYVHKNLRGAEFNGGVKVCDFENALKSFNKAFDIIFLDPPYGSGYAERAINFIADNNMLSDNGIICYEHSDDIEYSATPKGMEIKDTRKYGKVIICFIGRSL